MWPNLPFLSVASNALLKPGGLLRWNKRLVKDARLLLLLTEVIKIARLTSSLLDSPRQSLQRPKLRHGKQPALLSHLNLTLNLYTLFFALSLALIPRLPPLLTARWCKECNACQTAKIQRHTRAPISSRTPPAGHFLSVHMDLVGPAFLNRGSADDH